MKLKSVLKKAVVYTMLLSVFTACDKNDDSDDNTGTEEKGTIAFMLENQFGHDSPLLIGQKYTRSNGDTLTFTSCKLFISNVILKDEAGNATEVPGSYYLTQSSESSSTVMRMAEVPVGEYTDIEFVIGVDSLANLIEFDETGDLDPGDVNGDGMLWIWGQPDQASNGYKFIKIEGLYTKSDNTEGTFKYHVGTNDHVVEHVMSLPLSAKIRSGKTSEIHMVANISKIFDNAHSLDVAEVNNVTVGPVDHAQQIADNYGNGFIMIHHVENGD